MDKAAARLAATESETSDRRENMVKGGVSERVCSSAGNVLVRATRGRERRG
jgi:hypothetical protein